VGRSSAGIVTLFTFFVVQRASRVIKSAEIKEFST